MRKTLTYLGFGLATLLTFAALSVLLMPHFGWRIDIVFSGSMEPALKVGSLAVTRPFTAQSVKVGDIITFYSPLDMRLTTHRVLATQDTPALYFRTAGDANRSPDPFAVPAQNVVGTVCCRIPYLGYAAEFIKTPRGLLLTLLVPGLIVIVTEARTIRSTLNQESHRKRDKMGDEI